MPLPRVPLLLLLLVPQPPQMVPMVLQLLLLGLLPPLLPLAGQPVASRALLSPPGRASVVPPLAPPGWTPPVLLRPLQSTAVQLDRAMVSPMLRGLRRAVDPTARPSHLGKASNPSAETGAISSLTSLK